MERKDDRPSQDELRSLFNDYLTGKRPVTPPTTPAAPRKSRPPRPAAPPRAARPAPPPKESLPPNLSPAQLAKLKGLKGSLAPAQYQRILRLAGLALEPAAFFGTWDRLVNGYGMKGAAAVLLGELQPEEACVARLAGLLRCPPKDAKELVMDQRFAGLPVERRAIAVRDRIVQSAKRWDCPVEWAQRAVLGRLAQGELAAMLLARKLRVDDPTARALLGGAGAADPVGRALELALTIQREATERQAALSAVVAGRLEDLKAERLVGETVVRELSIPQDAASRLCERPPIRALAPGARARRAIEEVRSLAAALGCSALEACRQLCGELAAAELDTIVGRGIAAELGLELEAAVELGRSRELSSVPPTERAKKAARRARLLAEELRCGVREAAALLAGNASAALLAGVLRARLGLSESAAAALAGWLGSRPEGPAEGVQAAVERVERDARAGAYSAEQAALLVCGRVTVADLRAAQLVGELGIDLGLAGKLVAWMDAEKIGDAEAKVRIRNLRAWAAGTMELACRMLLKEIPTPTKSDSDALPFSGAWE